METQDVETPDHTNATQPVLPDEWRLILEMATLMRTASPSVTEPYLWPIRGLARRAANTSRGLAVLVMNGLWAEALIVGRSLMEMEITVKWLLARDVKDRLSRYIGAIHDEEERLARKLADGISVDAQMLNELVGDQLRDRLKNSPLRPDASPQDRRRRRSGWPYLSIREMAREVGLERNYELCYWIESVFTHVHPLSVLESHPTEWDHILCPLFACEARTGMPRAFCLVALPASILHLFATLDEALGLGLQATIDETWKAVHALLRDEESGVRWAPSEDIPPGEVRIYQPDGTVRRYTPKRL